MPIEPPLSLWGFPDLRDSRVESACGDLVAGGADLAPGTLLAAYSAGLFPMPDPDQPGHVHWWSPVERGVLPLRGLRITRSLAKSCRQMEIRVNTAFDAVLANCGDPNRNDGGWIDDEIRYAYSELHDLGWAHSVEAWRDDELVGGLYGVAIGGLFAGESMFHRARDASKVALVGLVELLSDEYVDQRILDVQWKTEHLASLGVVSVPRPTYLRGLAATLQVPLPSRFGSPAT